MKKSKAKDSQLQTGARPVVGWRERVDLPQLRLLGIKAKVDTGAKTSSLHVTRVSPVSAPDGSTWLQLEVEYSGADAAGQAVTCRAQSVGMRRVKSSTGHTENRHVIITTLRLGGLDYPIELTLSDRSDMAFPMLIGRSALRKRFLVDCGKSFLQSKMRRAPRARSKGNGGRT